MESQSSWRVATIASSEYEIVAPTAPGQRSPSLYPIGDDDFVFEHKRPTSLKASGVTQPKKCGSRADIAAKLLRDLEGLPSMNFEPDNDFGENWNEESLNLELFKELSDVGLRYTPPTTPNSDEFENQHQLSEFSDPTIQLVDSDEFPEFYDQISAEFQNILDSIPVTTTDESKEVESIKICGIPILQLEQEQVIVTTTEVLENDSVMQEDESDPDYSDQSQSSNSSGNNDNEMEATSDDEDDLELGCAFTETELAECGIVGDDKSLIPIEGSILDLSCKTEFDLELEGDDESDSDVSEDESMVDVESTVSEDTMKVLLGKRFTQSEAFMRKAREDLPSTSSKKKQEEAKSLKRIRGPSTSGGRTRVYKKKTKKNKKDSKNNARVKLQNRTAAARYRKKKKLEAAKVKEIENIIEKENDVLQGSYDDLKRQITLVKQLIRDVFKSKKTQTQQRRTTVLKTNVRK